MKMQLPQELALLNSSSACDGFCCNCSVVPLWISVDFAMLDYLLIPFYLHHKSLVSIVSVIFIQSASLAHLEIEWPRPRAHGPRCRGLLLEYPQGMVAVHPQEVIFYPAKISVFPSGASH